MTLDEAFAVLKQRLVNDPMSLDALKIIEDDYNQVSEGIRHLQGSGLTHYVDS